MDAIEKAIRSAFEKGNAEDRPFREKVYRSAFAALDRALQANPSLTVEAAINRRKALQAKITEIESEFLPAVQQAAPSVELESPSTSPVRSAAPTVASRETAAPAVQAPAIRLAEEGEVPAAHRGAAEPPVEVTADRNDERVRRRSRPYAALFLAATLIAATGIGLWWAVQTGLLKSPAEVDTSIPAPPKTVEGEDFIPEAEAAPVLPGQADPQRDWIAVFSPADATEVSAPADTTAEVMKDASGDFLRVRSGASGSAISFDVGQGVLERLAGKKATFDIVARTEEGKQTQMSVDCNFGELGDCGRKRYLVGYERGDYLFEIELPAGQPGSGGTIAINSDFANEGKAVDIYEIKVSITE